MVLLFLSLVIISCSSCRNDKADKESDNFEKVRDSKLKSLENSKLPPGSVKVRALINSVKIDDNDLMNLVVDSVLGYGAAAPVISKGESLSLKVNEDQKKKILQNTENVVLIFKNRPSGRDEGTTNNWQLISIEE